MTQFTSFYGRTNRQEVWQVKTLKGCYFNVVFSWFLAIETKTQIVCVIKPYAKRYHHYQCWSLKLTLFVTRSFSFIRTIHTILFLCNNRCIRVKLSCEYVYDNKYILYEGYQFSCPSWECVLQLYKGKSRYFVK